MMAPGTSFHGLCHGYYRPESAAASGEEEGEVLSTRTTASGDPLPGEEAAAAEEEEAAAHAAARRRFIDFRLDLPEAYLRQLVLWCAGGAGWCSAAVAPDAAPPSAASHCATSTH